MRAYRIGDRIQIDMLKVFGFKCLDKSRFRKQQLTFVHCDNEEVRIVVSNPKGNMPVILKMIGIPNNLLSYLRN